VRRHLRTLAVTAVLVLAVGSGLRAQGQADADAKAKAEAAATEAQQQNAEALKRAEARTRLIPLSLDVVVSRYQGEKKISSLPYVLAVNTNDNSPGGVCQLRMGAQVPVPTTIISNKDAVPTQSFTYRDIGTNIDCSARTLDNGVFQLRLNVEDTSVYTNAQAGATPTVEQMPVFRTFRSTNTLVLRDGQSREFTAAADRVNGEVIRIAVTLRVVR
jgi:Bacterial type II and III secretion system protein